jgi:hypothetical protein
MSSAAVFFLAASVGGLFGGPAVYVPVADLTVDPGITRPPKTSPYVGPLRSSPLGDCLYFAYKGQVWKWPRPFRRDQLELVGKHDADVQLLAVSPDGRHLFSYGFDRTLRVWDPATGTEVRSVKDFTRGIGSLHVWPDSRTLTIRDHPASLTFRDTTTFRETSRIDLGPRGAGIGFSPVTDEICLDASTGPDTHIRLIDRRTGADCWSKPPRAEGASTVVFSPDGRFVAVGGDHTGLNLRERTSGALTHRLGALPHQQSRLDDEWKAEQVVFCGSLGTIVVAAGRRSRFVNVMHVFDPERYHSRRAKSRRIALPCEGVTGLCALDPYTIAVGTSDGKLGLLLLNRSVPVLPRTDFGKVELDHLFGELFGPDAAKAYAAVPAIVAQGNATVAKLKAQLRPVTAADPKDVAAAITRLGDNDFRIRDRAEKEVVGFGDQALPIVLEHEAKAADPQVRSALGRIKGQLVKYTADHVTYTRGCHVLALIGTPEAVAVLKVLADGAPGDRRTWDAMRTLAVLSFNKE